MLVVTLLAHVVMTLPWLSLVILSMLRIRWATPEGDAPSRHPRPSTVASHVGRLTVLPLVGGSIGLAVVAGSTVLPGVIALAYTAAPWYRIEPCRQRPVLASVLMFCGGTIVVILLRRQVELMFLPVAGWLLGMASHNRGQIVGRKVDISGFANAVALSAAHEPNGTSAGIASARARARAAAESLRYQYFYNGIQSCDPGNTSTCVAVRSQPMFSMANIPARFPTARTISMVDTFGYE